jgi:hypothetical protein
MAKKRQQKKKSEENCGGGIDVLQFLQALKEIGVKRYQGHGFAVDFGPDDSEAEPVVGFRIDQEEEEDEEDPDGC